MGRPAKINVEELQIMIEQGKTLKAISERFSCSVAAVSAAKKKLGISVVKNAVAEHASTIVKKKLNQIDQLEKINSHANWLLDHVMKWVKGDDTAIQVLEAQSRKVNIGTKKNPKYVDKVKFQDPHKIALDSMAEIRNQLRLQLEIFKTLYDAEAVREFQNELIVLLAEVDPSVRDEFIRRLREKCAVRSILEIPSN